MRVLIVDDSKAMRMIVARELRQAGFGDLVITEAASGPEAIDAVGEFSPELILSDWNMPGMSGLELLQALNAKGFPGVFGFITTEASAEMRTAADDAGARFFVTKPFTTDVLRDVLSGVVTAAS